MKILYACGVRGITALGSARQTVRWSGAPRRREVSPGARWGEPTARRGDEQLEQLHWRRRGGICASRQPSQQQEVLTADHACSEAMTRRGKEQHGLGEEIASKMPRIRNVWELREADEQHLTSQETVTDQRRSQEQERPHNYCNYWNTLNHSDQQAKHGRGQGEVGRFSRFRGTEVGRTGPRAHRMPMKFREGKDRKTNRPTCRIGQVFIQDFPQISAFFRKKQDFPADSSKHAGKL